MFDRWSVVVGAGVVAAGMSAAMLAGAGLALAAPDGAAGATATSISDASGNAADLDTVQNALLANLDSEFDTMKADPAVTINRWKARLTTLGQKITVHERNRVLTGVAIDVDRNGHLLLRTNDRMVHVLTEGDVTLRS